MHAHTAAMSTEAEWKIPSYLISLYELKGKKEFFWVYILKGTQYPVKGSQFLFLSMKTIDLLYLSSGYYFSDIILIYCIL